MRNFFERHHYDTEPLPGWHGLFLPLEWAYSLVVRLRLLAFSLKLLGRVELPVPVISIGNLTTGGTGKTPLIEALATLFLDAGQRVVILCRGYGAKKPLRYGRASHPDHGDEAYAIQQHLPEAVVIVGKNRVKTARRAIKEFSPDVILLDDGFQHVRLGRQYNILLIDADRQFGNGHLLPLGPLREPLESLKRADTIWLTKVPVERKKLDALKQTIAPYLKPGMLPLQVGFPATGLLRVEDNTTVSAESVRHKKVIALSAIANPNRFLADLNSLELVPESHEVFPDHHNYKEAELRKIFSRLNDETILITTEKDRWKIEPWLPRDKRSSVYTLQVSPQLDPRWIPPNILHMISDAQPVPSSW